jgi:hypothetical protein
VPAGYHLESHTRTGFVIAGSIVVGIGYIFVAPAGMGSEDSGNHWLIVPVIGPWAAMAAHKHCSDRNDCGELSSVGEGLEDMLLTFDGIIQATGAILLSVGLFAKKDVLVRDDVATTLHHISVSPMIGGRTGTGLMLTGYAF